MTIKQIPPSRQGVGTSVIAGRYKVGIPKVHAWIKAGLLRAVDVRTPGTSKPRYQIDLDDLPAFEAAIAVHPQVDGGGE